jgi:hypothetical protein
MPYMLLSRSLQAIILKNMTSMVRDYTAFHEHVELKYQIYNGLFLDLPFEHVRSRGVMLPIFAAYCKERLEAGEDPDVIV